MHIQIKNTARLRLAWILPSSAETQYGSYMFDTPQEAEKAMHVMQAAFSDIIVWIEDREHNRIETAPV